ncbi:MAG: hypothetical protein LBS65_01770 [Desulfovibrio sp.]|jgi:hypothetical protein|nr:hypothetical protein [Desulfovibrio sp.]
MANDAATHPNLVSAQSEDADDEIVDLLEVIKPGRNVPRSAADDADFTADLDSMLDTLSATEKARADGIKNLDPNPVGYKVDHNESLNLPDMDELDDILASLAPDDRSALRQAPAPSPEITLPEAPDLPDLDALPFAEDSGAASEDLPSDAEESAPRADMKSAPEKDGALEDALLDSLLERADADGSAVPAQDDSESDTDAAMIDMEGLENILGGAGEPAAKAEAPDLPPLSGQGGSGAFAFGTDDDPGLTPDAAGADERQDGEDDDSGLAPDAAGADDRQDGGDADSGLAPDAADAEDRQDGEDDDSGLAPDAAGADAGEDAGAERPLAAGAPHDEAAPRFGPENPEEVDRNFAGRTGEAEDMAGGKAAPDDMPPAPDADFGRTTDFDEVDLVELDALLDDMLAGAPVSGPGPGETPSVTGSRAEQAVPGGGALPEKETLPPDADGEMEISASPEAGEERETRGQPPGADEEQEIRGQPPEPADGVRSLRMDFDAMRADFDALRAAFDAQEDRKQGRADGFADLLKSHGARLDGHDLSRDDCEGLLKAHGARLDELELGRDDSGKLLKSHGARLDGHDLSRDDSEKLLKSHGVRLDELELGRAAQADDKGELLKKLEETREELSVLGRRFDGMEARLAGLQAGLDKTAAAAAARVIREELAALLAAPE